MDIAIHLGAHCTDEDLILRTLGDNGDRLRREGCFMPAGLKARPALRKALHRADAGGDARPAPSLLSDLLEDADAQRLILSYEGFLGTYASAIEADGLYRDAGRRCAMLRDLFPGEAVQFYLALRNPATFVPALFEASSVSDFRTFLAGGDLGAIDWSGPIDAIREACPDVPLTVWCNEDLPLVWPDVLNAIAGTDGALTGEDAILRQIMTPDGFQRLQGYLAANPAPSRATWRRVVTAFLGKYADETVVEPEIALPGWTDGMIAGLSDLYEKDVARLRARDDLTFIAP